MFIWRNVLRKFLLDALKRLSKVSEVADLRKTSVFRKDIHIPTWILTIIIFVSFLGIYIYELGYYYKTVLAILMLLTLVLSLTIYFMRESCPNVLKCDDSVTLMGFLLIFFALLILVVKKYNLHPLITPLPAAVMMTNILIGPFPALIVSLITLTTMTIFYDYNFIYFFIMLIACLVAISCTMRVVHRRDVTKGGLYIGLVNIVSIGILKFLHPTLLPNAIEMSVWGFLNGFICAFVTMGFLPYMESFFSVTTNIKLLELADFTQPILKRLMMEAPGTYHHSIVVGNLGEMAARDIGANALLVRVGSYYHDIGKLGKAEYFSENMPQHVISKHDEMTPNLSSLVILSHVKDGVGLANKIKLDKSIVNMIEQHHGTSLIHYFYHKAKTSSNEEIDEEKYRYPGPKPKSKEAAIIMLADSVEAATHSDDDFTHAHLKDTVTKIINNKFVDGQLDECQITLKDLHQIASSFLKTLTGMYHSRVEYPSLDKEKDQVKGKKNINKKKQ